MPTWTQVTNTAAWMVAVGAAAAALYAVSRLADRAIDAVFGVSE